MSTATKSPAVVVTVATFDDVHPVFRVKRSKKIRKFDPLTGDDYRPRGNTPLRDATMKMIAHMEDLQSDDTIQIGLLLDESYSMNGNRAAVIAGVNEFVEGMRDAPAREGGRVLCVIFTDGHENASREVTSHDLTAKVRELEGNGWTFIFMGANMDAWGEGRRQTGISGGVTGQSVNFTSSPIGTAAAFRSEGGLRGRTSSYLAGEETYAAAAASFGNNSTVNEDGTVDSAAFGADPGISVNDPNTVTAKPSEYTPPPSPYSDVEDALKQARGGDEI